VTFRALRRRAGFTTTSLAACCQRIARGAFNRETISHIERGRVRDPRYSTVETLATALHTTTAAVAIAIRNTRAPRRRRAPRKGVQSHA